MQKLSVELKNTPVGASPACSSVISPELNREETLSALRIQYWPITAPRRI